MVKINVNYNKLASSYFFLEVNKKVNVFEEENPEVKVIRLSVGNTTEALPASVIAGLELGVKKLSDVTTYTGYGEEQGDIRLRKALSKFYKGRYRAIFEPQEIFISDGSKPDCANILSIFSSGSIVAMADPVYPVYTDSSIISGKTVVYLPCTEKNKFLPDPPEGKVDIVYICSPNNPTGAVMNNKQLRNFVDYALQNKALIIFDAAYAEYIQDNDLPRSIYQIPGAKKCAIEINSFSKWAGFTGVRLGWTIVPNELIVEGGESGRVNGLWRRRQTTMFNGASNIAQEGGLAVLTKKGQKECKKIIDYYMRNAEIIKMGFLKLGLQVSGGDNAPYIWLKTPDGLSSWEFFEKLLKEAHVVAVPGIGFGSKGEGYLRISAFGHRENVEKAMENIKKNLRLSS